MTVCSLYGTCTAVSGLPRKVDFTESRLIKSVDVTLMTFFAWIASAFLSFSLLFTNFTCAFPRSLRLLNVQYLKFFLYFSFRGHPEIVGRRSRTRRPMCPPTPLSVMVRTQTAPP